MLTVTRDSELPALTSLRGLAALAVLAYHCQISGLMGGSRIGIAMSHGYLAVDLFFMLSGFVLTHVYGQRFSQDVRPADFLSFIWARIARIYPVHLTVLLMLLPLYGTPGYSCAALVRSLTFTQLFSATPLAWNPVAWSINTEWYVYLLFPLAVPRLFRSRPATVLVLLAVVTAAAIGLDWLDGSIAFSRAVPEFMAGVLLCRCFAAGWFTPFWRSDYACAGFALAILGLAATERFTVILIVVAMAGLLLCCAHNRGAARRALTTRPLSFLGHISYSLYLVQGLCAPIVHAVFGAGTEFDLSFVALSFALAVPMSLCIEYPARAFLRRRRRTMPAVPA